MKRTTRVTVDQVFELAFATAPLQAGKTAELTTVHDTDGTDVLFDADGEAIVFPVALEESAPGVYSTEVVFPEAGLYFARATIDGAELPPAIVRVEPDGFPAADAKVDVPYTVGLVLGGVSSVQLTVRDVPGGETAGVGDDDTAITYPVSMVVVPGYGDEWSYDSIQFTEGGRYASEFVPNVGPIRSAVISVAVDASSSAFTHRSGWTPTVGMDAGKWAALSYIRRWTGWTDAAMGAEDLRELRRMAIQTFIDETGVWVPGWDGTFYQLRGQGCRLYLPMPIVLPSDGGIEPVVTVTEQFGNQNTITTIDNDDLTFMVRGSATKQPYIESGFNGWDPYYDVKITATWGIVGIDTRVPVNVKQAIVGLVRWHSTSLGVDGEDARMQSTGNRTTDENTRDARVSIHDSALGRGVTGDKTVDSILARYRIADGPWAVRCGPNFGPY